MHQEQHLSMPFNHICAGGSQTNWTQLVLWGCFHCSSSLLQCSNTSLQFLLLEMVAEVFATFESFGIGMSTKNEKGQVFNASKWPLGIEAQSAGGASEVTINGEEWRTHQDDWSITCWAAGWNLCCRDYRVPWNFWGMRNATWSLTLQVSPKNFTIQEVLIPNMNKCQ